MQVRHIRQTLKSDTDHNEVICGALRDMAPFVQFKKHPWRSVNFSETLKLTLLHRCFSRFLNCTNGTTSRNAPHLSHMVNFSF